MGLQLGLSFRLLPVRVQAERNNSGMSPENRETLLHPHLFPHQISAFNVLLARAQTYFSGHWRSLPIKTRWHSLLVGPTGTGKTALARMVADATGAAIFQIGAANWMPSGAHDRATSQTLPLLLKHIARHERTVLFIDEVDKVHVHAVDSPWLNFIKQELLEIYDGRWNIGLKSDDDDETLDTEHISGNKLRTATFIVSAGTFQDYYDDRPRVAVGFHRLQPSLPRPSLSSDEIAKWLPRELVNRHHSELIRLPELVSEQYHELARQAEKSLPNWLVPGFRKAAQARFQQAIASKSGCRYVEESLAEALMASSPEMGNPTVVTSKITQE